MNVPDAVDVPDIVMVLLLQVAFNPDGSPVTVPMPVAPVVAMVMDGVNAVLIQSVLGAGAAAVLLATTVMVPVALMFPQPPDNGMV